MKTSAATLLIVCVACTTVPGKGNSSDRREIVGLEEMSLEYIESSWGAPDSNTPRGDGRTVRFKNIRAETEDPISGRVDVKQCDIRLDLNNKQLVTSWEYENCRPQNSN